MIPLEQLLKGVDHSLTKGKADIPIAHISNDSRNIPENTLFVAVPGTRVDGHQYIPQAVEAGAVAVVYEHPPVQLTRGVCWIRVRNSARALGMMASAFYGHPSHSLELVGVTGTNGKTTIATLLYRLFTSLGYRSALISTVEYRLGNQAMPATHTTPDSLVLNRLMKEMADTGISHCFMEVSSHALVQERTAGLRFLGGIFTNISHDHLDYHKTFREYIHAKKKFFDELPGEAFALVNRDDRNADVMLQNTRARKLGYALKGMAEYKTRLVENHLTGMQMMTNGMEWWARLIGEFNASNLTAVFATAVELGQDPAEVIRLLSRTEPVRGRFETVYAPDGRVGIVDYAHTPDALENVLNTVLAVRQSRARIITVVGAGGDRDPGKRPVMAKIAARLSDRVVLTSDNPRSEEPENIIEQMRTGIEKEDGHKVLAITARKEAIRAACMMAEKNDIILVAGKGHENYQEIKGTRYPFDDKEILMEIFTKDK